MGRFLDLEGVDAVVFDCDGVLVDSEPVSEWVWRSTLDGHGIDMGPDFAAWIGTTDQGIAVRFAAEAGMSPARLADENAQAFVDRLAEVGIEVFDDALAALERTRAAGLGLAVATNSERWRLKAILEAAGLADVFSIAITSDDVARPKPAPDIYLEAVARLGMEPSRVVIVEDSPTGVAAGRSAGMRVVAVDRGVFEPAQLAPATRVVSNLTF